MRATVWFGGFVLGLILEASLLPVWIGGATPPIASAVFLAAVSGLAFWPGLFFAGFAGFTRDLLLPGTGAVGSVSSFAVFFAVQAFGALTQWEEPLKRIGALLVGLLAVIPGWLFGILAGRIFFATPLPAPAFGDLGSQPAVLAAAFHILWISIYSWFLIRAAQRFSLRRLERL